MRAASDSIAPGERNQLARFALMLARVAGLTTTAVAIACTEIAGPAETAAVALRVTPVIQAELSLLTDFTVDADVVNLSSAVILYDRWCNWRIQQLVNGTWAPAYTPLCSSEGREIYQLWPGETAVHRYPAHRSWRAGNGAQVPGSYRLVMSLYTGDPGRALNELRELVAASNTFIVR